MKAATGVKVCVRIRPTAHFAQDNIHVDLDKNAIRLNMANGIHEGSNKKDTYNFRYHQVLHNAGQESVYESLTRDIVQSSLDGINGAIMAYGQTGAGKTFTMIGDLEQYHQRGIMPRAMAHLFTEIGNRTEYEFKVSVSYMELYNERIFDLLNPENAAQSSQYTIVENKNQKGTYVRGLTYRQVDTEEDALKCLFEGSERRTVAQHVLNTTSNRSHCIFTVYIEQKSRLGSAEKVTHSKLCLVDLAGSERLKKVDVSDPRSGNRAVDATIKRESLYINKSLTYLEQCVVALTSKGRSHVPYRQTKLTNILKDTLGGNSNTLMISCVYGESRHLEETISTLRLSQRMMRVENRPEEISTIDPQRRIRHLEGQVKALKQELMMHDALAERSGIVYDEYTPEQRHDVAQQVRKYLEASPDEESDIFDLRSLRHVFEIFRQFKVLVKNVETQTEERLRQQFSMVEKAGRGLEREDTAPAEDTPKEDEDAQGSVGEVQGGAGYGVGIAPSQARPASIDMGGSGPMSPERDSKRPDSPGSPSSQRSGGMSPDGMRAGQRSPGSHRGLAQVPNSKNEAFELFKQRDGAQINDELMAMKRKLIRGRAAAKALREEINGHKRSIDQLSDQIDIKRTATRGQFSSKTEDGEEVVDEEEFRLIKERQEHKRSYRAKFAGYKEQQLELSALDREVQATRSSLVDQFNRWFADATGESLLDSANVGDDRLDEGEMFDKMEIERVLEDDPESVAFFLAQKARSKNRRKDLGRTRRAIQTKRSHK
eukprot:g4639.t1